MGTDNFDDTLEAVSKLDNLFVMTRSNKGSIIVHRGKQHVQEATPVEQVVDTTGAGDAYCAGFLYGWVHDKSLAECARAGTLCATAVIQQVGARIEKGVLD
jgi:sugar/nucleoside kinase (ribokinase family)